MKTETQRYSNWPVYIFVGVTILLIVLALIS